MTEALSFLYRVKPVLSLKHWIVFPFCGTMFLRETCLAETPTPLFSQFRPVK